MFEEIAQNIELIKKNIPDNVTLLVASKGASAEKINFAASHGVKLFGENKVNELLSKYDALSDDVEMHFIGHLQTNKVKYIIDKVTMIQSLDSIKLAEEIEKQAKNHNIVMDVLVEINIAKEPSKSGIFPEDAFDFISELKNYPHLRVCGLMVIPPVEQKSEKRKENFIKVVNIFLDICSKKEDNDIMKILSMGMSDDYTEAIECGSTMVRIGSAVFGKRAAVTK